MTTTINDELTSFEQQFDNLVAELICKNDSYQLAILLQKLQAAEQVIAAHL